MPLPTLPETAAPKSLRASVVPAASPEAAAAIAALDGWSPIAPVPDALSGGRAEAALAEVISTLAPAGPEALSVLLLGLIEWAERWDRWHPRREGDVAALVADYCEALDDVPPDLLDAAIRQIRKTWKWRQLPTPADIREIVDPALSVRRSTAQRLRTVAGLAARPLPDLAGADAGKKALRIASSAVRRFPED